MQPPANKQPAPLRDTLFQQDVRPGDFEFNDRVVEVFDDMLDRSIPFYKEVIVSTSRLLDAFLCSGDTVFDLGCATGSTLLELARLLPDKRLDFIGIDNSRPMLEKARLKTELFSKQAVISFRQEDITAMEYTEAGAFLLNYTLQFIRPLKRQEFIRSLYAGLRPGGMLILSEKILLHDRELNRHYIDIYHQFKKGRGYSELEIAKKREALENVLIPFTIEENTALLKKAGFSSVAPFFQWFNFASFVAVKSS
ncbi:MAG: carboxy-S-adenosyl-L-methionine synthase CmoA [Desulfobulbaceae bacterium]|nr:MAG: carboxy-S-adenosyl-L-methionine synthase CmoA [Desulfobulbaceae bacterium]